MDTSAVLGIFFLFSLVELLAVGVGYGIAISSQRWAKRLEKGQTEEVEGTRK